MSQKALQLVEVFSNDLGNDVGRLFIRDTIIWSSQSMTPLDMYKITLRQFCPDRGIKRRRSGIVKRCRKCNKIKHRKSKRQRCILQSPTVKYNLNQQSSVNSFDFSSVPCDRQENFTFSIEQFSSSAPSAFVFVPSSNEDLYQYTYDQNATPLRSKLKRLYSELSEYEDFGLTDSMSKVCLHLMAKKPRLDSMFDDPF
ncbi:unnamed protein product [Hymenolepis diminuta]|nr:unnamed protein product [Hymenolepis diminuta]